MHDVGDCDTVYKCKTGKKGKNESEATYIHSYLLNCVIRK